MIGAFTESSVATPAPPRRFAIRFAAAGGPHGLKPRKANHAATRRSDTSDTDDR